jgi:hypothetical protein
MDRLNEAKSFLDRMSEAESLLHRGNDVAPNDKERGEYRSWWAKIFEVDLRETDVRGAKYNKNTIWPDGFDPKTAGAKLVG